MTVGCGERLKKKSKRLYDSVFTMSTFADNIDEELRKIEREIASGHGHRTSSAVYGAATPRGDSGGGPTTDELLASIGRVLAPSHSGADDRPHTSSSSASTSSGLYTSTVHTTATQQQQRYTGGGDVGRGGFDESLMQSRRVPGGVGGGGGAGSDSFSMGGGGGGGQLDSSMYSVGSRFGSAAVSTPGGVTRTPFTNLRHHQETKDGDGTRHGELQRCTFE